MTLKFRVDVYPLALAGARVARVSKQLIELLGRSPDLLPEFRTGHLACRRDGELQIICRSKERASHEHACRQTWDERVRAPSNPAT